MATSVPAPGTPAAAPVSVPPAVPVTAAPAAPPPPAPPPSDTDYSGWGAVPSLGTSITGWYITFYLGLLGYLALPFLVAVQFNAACHYGWNWGVLLVTTLIDVGLMFWPWGIASVSFAGVLRGQIGGQPNLNASDGYNTAKEWITTTAKFTASAILGKQIGLVWLIFFPIRGFGGEALAAVALIVLVLIGVARFSKTYWFARFCVFVYGGLLGVILLYWALASTVWPEIRQGRAASVASCLREEVREQNDRDLLAKAEIVAGKLATMDASLTEEERIAKLSPQDREVWRRTMESSFKSRFKKEVQPITDRASEFTGKATAAAKSAASAASATINAVTTTAQPPVTRRKPSSGPDEVWACERTVDEFNWEPRWDPEDKGALALRELPPGNYQVEASGLRHHVFFAGVDAPGSQPKPALICAMQTDGILGECRNPSGGIEKEFRFQGGYHLIEPKEKAAVLVPTSLYGTILVGLVSSNDGRGFWEPLGQKVRFSFGSGLRLALNTNYFQRPANYNGGAVHITIKSCEVA